MTDVKNAPSVPGVTNTASLKNNLRNLVAGGIAGMLAKTCVAPIDRIKIMYQITATKFHLRDIPHVARGIVKAEGFTALWKGNVATLIRVFPYSGVQFMVYDRCKHYFLMKKQEGHDLHGSNRTGIKHHLTPSESLLSGSFAGCVSVLVTYPLDLTRAQLAVLKNKRDGPSQGFVDVFMGNYRTRGFWGLFRGITPTLLGILPYAGVAFTINEQSKKSISTFTGRDPTNLERMFCGGMSGLVAQSITYPFEVTRRRMQTIGIVPTSGSEAAVDVLGTLSDQAPKAITDSSTNGNTMKLQQPPSMLKTMRHVMNEQGIGGFFKGVSMNWFKGPVAFSISFTTYDIIQGIFADSYGDDKKISFS